MEKIIYTWINVEGTYDYFGMNKPKRMEMLNLLSKIGKHYDAKVIISLYTGGKYEIIDNSIHGMKQNILDAALPNLELGDQICDYRYLNIKENTIDDIPKEVGYLCGDKIAYFEKKYKNIIETIVIDDFPDSTPYIYLRHEEPKKLVASGKRKLTVIDKHGRGFKICQDNMNFDNVEFLIMDGKREFLLEGLRILVERFDD